jgi:hypothetical protein
MDLINAHDIKEGILFIRDSMQLMGARREPTKVAGSASPFKRTRIAV